MGETYRSVAADVGCSTVALGQWIKESKANLPPPDPATFARGLPPDYSDWLASIKTRIAVKMAMLAEQSLDLALAIIEKGQEPGFIEKNPETALQYAQWAIVQGDRVAGELQGTGLALPDRGQ